MLAHTYVCMFVRRRREGGMYVCTCFFARLHACVLMHARTSKPVPSPPTRAGCVRRPEKCRPMSLAYANVDKGSA